MPLRCKGFNKKQKLILSMLLHVVKELYIHLYKISVKMNGSLRILPSFSASFSLIPSNLYITNAKMGKVLTIEEFSNIAWRVICGASIGSNHGFKLNSESLPFNVHIILNFKTVRN